jgi:hypothetical protein
VAACLASSPDRWRARRARTGVVLHEALRRRHLASLPPARQVMMTQAGRADLLPPRARQVLHKKTAAAADERALAASGTRGDLEQKIAALIAEAMQAIARTLAALVKQGVLDLQAWIERERQHPFEILEPPTWTPRIDEPMVQALLRHAPRYLLPGLDGIPDNTIFFLRENRRFIEALLVGANHELGRELAWREVAFDRHGTIFRHFWGGGPAIRDLRTWVVPEGPDGAMTLARLGDNAPAPASSAERLVVGIKGDIIRLVPNPSAFLIHCDPAALAGMIEHLFDPALPSGVWAPEVEQSLASDVLLMGFPPAVSEPRVRAEPERWHFVIAEAPTRPRFGLDAAAGAPASPVSIDEVTWAHVETDPASRWITRFRDFDLRDPAGHVAGDSIRAAMVASLTLQRPAILVVPFTKAVQ